MKQIALVIALCLGAIAVQGSAAGSVPFQATIDTVVTPLGPCGATCLTLDISGSGQALHMGRTTIDGPSHIDFATLEQSGTSTLTAADGSTLTIGFDGDFVPGPGPQDASFSGTWEVLSGTGRFEGASGGGSYGGSASGSAGVLHMQGTLAGLGAF
jgi:hypothetical protein